MPLNKETKPYLLAQSSCSKYCYVSFTIQLNISHISTRLNGPTVLFQTIRFSEVEMSNSSIWSLENTLSGAYTPGQSGPASNDNKELHISPSSRARASPSDSFVLSVEHSQGGGLTSLK